jgi:vitamin B12 transporter
MNKKSLQNKIRKHLLTVSLLSVSMLTHAQEPEQDGQIEEVVISASRYEQNIKDVSRSVTVISNEDIQNSMYNNVSELLSSVQGINIIGTGQNPGSLQSIYLRGTGSNQTIIMIDGIRINDPSTVNNAIDLSELSTLNIERIEIVRGAHSTLFGSSAIGGIINIITKKSKTAGFHAAAGIKTGLFGDSAFELSENLDLNYTGKSGIYANIELFNSNLNGLDATIDTITDQNAYKNRDNDDFDKFDISGKLGIINDKWDVFASYKYTYQLSDLDDGAYTDDDNHRLNFNRNLITYQIAYSPVTDLKLKLLGGYTDLKRIVTDDSSQIDQIGTYDHAFAKDIFTGIVMNSELQADYSLNNIRILFGLGRFEDKMNAESYYLNTAWMYELESNLDSLDLKSHTHTSFAHIGINGAIISEKMNFIQLYIGGRYNNHSTFGDYFTYEISPLFKLGKFINLFGTFSTGFNTPSLYQLYSPSVNYISEIRRGNEKLNPESSLSMEAGINFITNKIKIDFSLFQTNIENLIEYVYLWDNAIELTDLGNDWMRDDFRGDTYINLGEQNIQGIEFGISAKPHEKILIAANFHFLNGENFYEADQNDIANQYHVQLYSTGDFLNEKVEIEGLTRRSNTANFMINYKIIENLFLCADLKYVGGKEDIFYDPALGPYGALGTQDVDEYSLIGSTVQYKLFDRLLLSIRFDNILDTEYQELLGYTTRGRGYFLKIRYEF